MHRSFRVCVLLLFLLIYNIGFSEEKEWYFDIIKFDNGGNSCVDGEGLIFFPGTVEGMKAGQKHPMYRIEGGQVQQVAIAEVIWVNMWESKVKIHLLEGVSRLKITDKVKIKVDMEKGFNFWWGKGVAWEKEMNYYDAFRAYYRAKLYKPSDTEVDKAYRRTGYGDYLTQGKQAMASKRYRSAISLFELALRFPWPAGDLSEARALIEKCKKALDVGKDTFSEKLKYAQQAMKDKNYLSLL